MPLSHFQEWFTFTLIIVGTWRWVKELSIPSWYWFACKAWRLTASNCNCLLFAEQSIKCSFPVRSKCRWSVQTAPSWSWEPIDRLGELSSFGYVEHTVFIKRMLVFRISMSIEYSKTEQLNKLRCTNNWISFVYVGYIYICIQGVTGGTDQTSGGCSLC